MTQITIERVKAQQVLEALDIAQGLLADARSYHQPKMLAAYTAIKQALAEPMQEPVAFEDWHSANYRQTLEKYGDSYKNMHVRNRWQGWLGAKSTTPPAQPAQQGPVAWLKRHELADLQTLNHRRLGADSPNIWAPNAPDAPPPELDLVAVYTTPPAAQRQWVRLTGAEMYLNCPNWLSHEQCKTWVQQIEAKLKEKNT
jgi:hypothetical protein